MKKIKTVAIISGALTFLQLIPIMIQVVMQTYFGFSLKYASAIGIIGEADGPTSIVVAHVINPLFVMSGRYGFLLICGLTFIVSMVLYFKKRKQSSDD